jgi:hypothetical protein
MLTMLLMPMNALMKTLGYTAEKYRGMLLCQKKLPATESSTLCL